MATAVAQTVQSPESAHLWALERTVRLGVIVLEHGTAAGGVSFGVTTAARAAVCGCRWSHGRARATWRGVHDDQSQRAPGPPSAEAAWRPWNDVSETHRRTLTQHAVHCGILPSGESRIMPGRPQGVRSNDGQEC
jgi:hypothetical protein